LEGEPFPRAGDLLVGFGVFPVGEAASSFWAAAAIEVAVA
jgi:hypothetical protein